MALPMPETRRPPPVATQAPGWAPPWVDFVEQPAARLRAVAPKVRSAVPELKSAWRVHGARADPDGKSPVDDREQAWQKDAGRMPGRTDAHALERIALRSRRAVRNAPVRRGTSDERP